MKALGAFVLAAAGVFAQAVPNVAGNWTVTAMSSRVDATYQATFQLAQSGTTITGQTVILTGNPCSSGGSLTG
jgi:hypothetical protein